MATAFRPAAAGDFEPIVDALRDGYAEAGEPFPAARAGAWLGSLLAASGDAVWLIERNGGFAGFAMLHDCPDSNPRRVYVTGLYVTPHLRGIGLGPTTLDLLRDLSRLHGTRLLEHDLAHESKLPRVPAQIRKLAA